MRQLTLWGLEIHARPYRESNLASKKQNGKQKADYDTYARCKVLCDIVSVVDAQRSQHATTGLENDQSPDNPAVTVEEAVLRDLLAVLEHNSDKEGRDEGVKGELDVPDPDRCGRMRILEHFLEEDPC